MYSCSISTAIGTLSATATEAGIASLRIGAAVPESSDSHPHFELLRRELEAYFEGRLTAFTVPLDPAGTTFQRGVWNALLQIPFGETRSYGQQARLLGDEKAIRAVARANGANPLMILIPCHRIIGADGSLTGYAGGLEAKQWLLAHEGRVSGRTTQPSLF